MAFTKRQYENFIRTIIVAAVAKEFRRAKIIEGVIKRAKADGKVATGGLIRPDVTNSIIPTRDDRWLLKRESVKVNVGKVMYNVPTNVSVELNIEYGVDPDYIYTRRDINAQWPLGKLPNVDRIKTWVIAKSSRGLLNFKYRGKPLDVDNEKQVSRVAFAVRRSIGRKGISTKYKSNYFKPVKDEVNEALRIGVAKASDRIVEKYQEDIYNSIVNTIDINVA